MVVLHWEKEPRFRSRAMHLPGEKNHSRRERASEIRVKGGRSRCAHRRAMRFLHESPIHVSATHTTVSAPIRMHRRMLLRFSARRWVRLRLLGCFRVLASGGTVRSLHLVGGQFRSAVDSAALALAVHPPPPGCPCLFLPGPLLPSLLRSTAVTRAVREAERGTLHSHSVTDIIKLVYKTVHGK